MELIKHSLGFVKRHKKAILITSLCSGAVYLGVKYVKSQTMLISNVLESHWQRMEMERERSEMKKQLGKKVSEKSFAGFLSALRKSIYTKMDIDVIVRELKKLRQLEHSAERKLVAWQKLIQQGITRMFVVSCAFSVLFVLTFVHLHILCREKFENGQDLEEESLSVILNHFLSRGLEDIIKVVDDVMEKDSKCEDSIAFHPDAFHLNTNRMMGWQNIDPDYCIHMDTFVGMVQRLQKEIQNANICGIGIHRNVQVEHIQETMQWMESEEGRAVWKQTMDATFDTMCKEFQNTVFASEVKRPIAKIIPSMTSVVNRLFIFKDRASLGEVLCTELANTKELDFLCQSILYEQTVVPKSINQE